MNTGDRVVLINSVIRVNGMITGEKLTGTIIRAEDHQSLVRIDQRLDYKYAPDTIWCENRSLKLKEGKE